MKKTRYLFAWLFMLAAMPVFVACGDDDAPSGIHTGNAVAVDLLTSSIFQIKKIDD